MPRPQGLPKTGGRRKGTPNRRTQSLEDNLMRLGVDIPSQIISLLPELPCEKKADVLMALMGFLYPKRKAIEQQIELERAPEKEKPTEEIRKDLAKLYRTNTMMTNDPHLAAAFNKIADAYENYDPNKWDE